MNQMINFYVRSILLSILMVILMGCVAHRSEMRYYEYCNEAELAIIKEDFEKAYKAYQKAFKTSHPGFARDFYNALRVSESVNQSDLAYEYAWKLANLGMCTDFFYLNTNLKDTPELLKKVVEVAPVFNEQYKQQLEKMANEDQIARYDRSDLENINRVDSLNFLEFKMLVKENGFPDERMLGLECTDNNQGFNPPSYRILLLHFAQHRYKGVKEILDNALADKKMSPQMYMDYVQYLGLGIRYQPAPVVKIDGNYYTYKMTDAEIKEINENRAVIKAPSLEAQIEKIKFKVKNGLMRYRIYTAIDQFSGLEQSVIDTVFVKLEF